MFRDIFHLVEGITDDGITHAYVCILLYAMTRQSNNACKLSQVKEHICKTHCTRTTPLRTRIRT